MKVTVRVERPADADAIRALIDAAFAGAKHASGTESLIVEELRREGSLSISLVATIGDRVTGHIAASPVQIAGGPAGWFGLGPLAVLPDWQCRGIGDRLMREAIAMLRVSGAAGCVLLGDPAYYRRFGFHSQPGLVLPGVPPEYFQALGFGGEMPSGEVRYRPAFAIEL